MATAIFKHDYVEAVDIKHNWIKTGEIRLFWGMIVIPKGYMEENRIFLGFCALCKQMHHEEVKNVMEK